MESARGTAEVSAGRDGDGGVDVAGGRRREEEDEEDGCACFRSIYSLAILAQVLSCDSLPPAAPANEVWWRGDSGRFLNVSGLAWGCLGVVVSGVAAGGGLGFGILGCCLVVPAEAGVSGAWWANVDERFARRPGGAG